MVTIAFPGLGIEPFTINKIAFTVPIFGGVEVRWYGLIITFGIILAFMYAWYRSKQERVAIDDLLDIAIYAVIFAVIGARIYYVLFDIIGNGAGDNYRSFIDYIAIWRGGIAIYGAIIGGALSIYVVCKCKKIKWQRVFDMVSPGVMIGQILGRWGNFFNGEAFGGVPQEGTFLYRFRMEVAQDYWYSGVTAHPTFFYESFWNLIGFLIINAIYKKKRFDGEVFLWYITWYGFGRMLVEGLRTDSLWLGRIRISQLVGALCFVVGLALTLIFHIKAVKKGTRPIAALAVNAPEDATAAAGSDKASVEAEADAVNNAEKSSDEKNIAGENGEEQSKDAGAPEDVDSGENR